MPDFPRLDEYTGCLKKRVMFVQMAITSRYKITSLEMEKVRVVWKIQHKCCMILIIHNFKLTTHCTVDESFT